MERIRKVWPKWEPLEILGQGGFGTVYKCKRENMLDVSYSAIKVVKIPNDESEVKEMTTSGMTKEHIQSYYKESVIALLNEIKLMESLKSASNIVGIEDYEVVENEDGIGWTIFIRMELLTNLSDYIESTNFTRQQVVDMGIDICKALEVCHQEKIIHRDIKPGNIFVSRFGDFKLGDFGVSKEVEQFNATMSQKGTKSYMAPEMIKLEKTYDHTVDIYALGLTMYELLNHGRMPFLPNYPEPFFPKQREEAMFSRLSGKELPDIEGLGELNAILKKACHFDPKQRYQSATEFKRDLMKVNIGNEPIKDHDIPDPREKSKSLNNSEDITKGINSDISIFNSDITTKTNSDNDILIKEDSDVTLGIFGPGKMLFEDEKTIKEVKVEVENEPLTIKCPICGKNASLVFTHGYYCGKHVTTTSEDENVLKVKGIFEKYITGTNTRAYLKKMIALDDHFMLHYRLGKEYLESGTKRYMKSEYERAYQLNPNHPMICKNYAVVCLEEKRYEEGLEAITKAEGSENELVILVKAILLQKLKRYDEALQALVVAIERCKTYKFEWHFYGANDLFTSASILEFLYEKKGAVQFEEMYYLHQIYRIAAFYGIGKNVYKQIFENNRLKHNILAYGANLPNSPTVIRNEECWVKKTTLSKMFYIGSQGIYVYSTLFTVGLTFISYFELATQSSISTKGTDLIIKRGKTEVVIPIAKNQQTWIYESIAAIIKYNKKCLEGN